MNKKLYYTIEKELQSNGECEETTGFKSISLYSIENNTPEIIAQINDVELSTKSTDAIQDYLNDNGFKDETFDMILL